MSVTGTNPVAYAGFVTALANNQVPELSAAEFGAVFEGGIIGKTGWLRPQFLLKLAADVSAASNGQAILEMAPKPGIEKTLHKESFFLVCRRLEASTVRDSDGTRPLLVVKSRQKFTITADSLRKVGEVEEYPFAD